MSSNKYLYAEWVTQNHDPIKYCYCGGGRVNVCGDSKPVLGLAPNPTLPPGHSSLPPLTLPAATGHFPHS